MIRWAATVTYRTDNGPLTVEYLLSELKDLDNLVERGPHWDTIAGIAVERVNHCTDPHLTIEEAARL